MLSERERKDLLGLYRDVDAQVAAAGPRCDASGRCCRFKEYGHTLFLSEVEAEFLLDEGLPDDSVVSSEGCPFQRGGLCTARERRPLGCRIYFCDPDWGDRQHEVSESFIKRLKDLHENWNRKWNYRPLEHHLAGAGTSVEPHSMLPIIEWT